MHLVDLRHLTALGSVTDHREYCGYAPEDSANTILVAAKTGEKRIVACVLLVDSRLDVNHTI